ncbi:hypothetical protein [Nonomuraea jabiensis]|uniref:hypothetical protein n=1 Tax=Nonomuraea jabiensis TaxID=882448 RepID=UPI003D710833
MSRKDEVREFLISGRAHVTLSVRRVLDKLAVPAVVVNTQQDLIDANLMGRALFAPRFEAFEMPGGPGLSSCAYSAEEGSPSAGRFALLSSWAANQAREE